MQVSDNGAPSAECDLAEDDEPTRVQMEAANRYRRGKPPASS